MPDHRGNIGLGQGDMRHDFAWSAERGKSLRYPSEYTSGLYSASKNTLILIFRLFVLFK